jgi:hypothetical protein
VPNPSLFINIVHDITLFERQPVHPMRRWKSRIMYREQISIELTETRSELNDTLAWNAATQFLRLLTTAERFNPVSAEELIDKPRLLLQEKVKFIGVPLRD